MKKLILVSALFIAANPFITKAQELKAVPCATFEYMRDVQMKSTFLANILKIFLTEFMSYNLMLMG